MDSNMYTDKQLQLGHHDHALVLSSWALNRDVHFFITLHIIFPNVQHLIIGVQNVSSSNHCLLSRFLAVFPKLVRLSVFFKWDSEEDSPTTKYPELCEYFFQFIGSMKSLKHLDLLGDSMLGCDKIADHLPNVLPQLEHLSMENSQYGNSGSILAKLGPNLKSLRLDQFENFQETMQSSVSSELTANLTELRVSKVTNLKTVEFVCQTFLHLNKLELSFEISDDEEVLPKFPLDSNLITILNSHPKIDSISLDSREFANQL